MASVRANGGPTRSARAASCSSVALSTRARSGTASWPARPDAMSATITTASLSEQVQAIEAGAEVTGIGWLGATAALALGDGTVVFAREGETRRVEAHPDAGILVSAADGKRLVTGGDDGRLVAINTDGNAAMLAETGGAWIDAIALHPSGA